MMAFSGTVLDQAVQESVSAGTTAGPFLVKSLSRLLAPGNLPSSIKSKCEKRAVLVMGGTGLVGGAVVRGLLSYPWFCVMVATRRPWCAEAVLLKQAGAKIVEVDFNYKHSLLVAMQGVKCVFLHTMYWENYSCSLEIVHGKNAVEAAVEAGVEHLVFNGTNYVKPEHGRVCSFLRSKLEIEEYIRDSGLAFTIVVLPFYFENFLTVFRPFEITPDLFAMTLPLENCLISCACLHDMALCICKIIQQGSLYMDHKVTLAAEMLSVHQMTANLAKGLNGYNFIDPELTVEDFLEFEFPGAKDLAAMFLFYQLCEDIPDFSVTRTLNPHTRTMVQWIADNRNQLYDVLESHPSTPDQQGKYCKPIHLRQHTRVAAVGGVTDRGAEEEEEEEEEEEQVPSRPPSLVVVGDMEPRSHNLSNNSDHVHLPDSTLQKRLSVGPFLHSRRMSSQTVIRNFLRKDFESVQRRVNERWNAIAVRRSTTGTPSRSRSRSRSSSPRTLSPSPTMSRSATDQVPTLETGSPQQQVTGTEIGDVHLGPPSPDTPQAQGTTQDYHGWSLLPEDEQIIRVIKRKVGLVGWTEKVPTVEETPASGKASSRKGKVPIVVETPAFGKASSRKGKVPTVVMIRASGKASSRKGKVPTVVVIPASGKGSSRKGKKEKACVMDSKCPRARKDLEPVPCVESHDDPPPASAVSEITGGADQVRSAPTSLLLDPQRRHHGKQDRVHLPTSLPIASLPTTFLSITSCQTCDYSNNGNCQDEDYDHDYDCDFPPGPAAVSPLNRGSEGGTGRCHKPHPDGPPAPVVGVGMDEYDTDSAHIPHPHYPLATPRDGDHGKVKDAGHGKVKGYGQAQPVNYADLGEESESESESEWDRVSYGFPGHLPTFPAVTDVKPSPARRETNRGTRVQINSPSISSLSVESDSNSDAMKEKAGRDTRDAAPAKPRSNRQQQVPWVSQYHPVMNVSGVSFAQTASQSDQTSSSISASSFSFFSSTSSTSSSTTLLTPSSSERKLLPCNWKTSIFSFDAFTKGDKPFCQRRLPGKGRKPRFPTQAAAEGLTKKKDSAVRFTSSQAVDSSSGGEPCGGDKKLWGWGWGRGRGRGRSSEPESSSSYASILFSDDNDHSHQPFS